MSAPKGIVVSPASLSDPPPPRRRADPRPLSSPRSTASMDHREGRRVSVVRVRPSRRARAVRVRPWHVGVHDLPDPDDARPRRRPRLSRRCRSRRRGSPTSDCSCSSSVARRRPPSTVCGGSRGSGRSVIVLIVVFVAMYGLGSQLLPSAAPPARRQGRTAADRLGGPRGLPRLASAGHHRRRRRRSGLLVLVWLMVMKPG